MISKYKYILLKYIYFIIDTKWIFLFTPILFTIIGVIIYVTSNIDLTTIFKITFLGFFVAILIYAPNYKIGKTLLINRLRKTIHIRGYINTSNIDITSPEGKNQFKKIISEDIHELVNYIKTKRIKHFKTKTHKAYYEILLKELNLIDENSNNNNILNDIKKYKKNTFSNEDCIVKIKLKKRCHKIYERIILLSYDYLINSKEGDEIIINRDQYSISVKMNYNKTNTNAKQII